MKKKLLLGLMAMTLPLSTWAAFDVTLAKSTITYNGTETKPEITVKDGSKTLVENSDYALVYKKKADGAATTLTNVGAYTVTVQGLGATYGAQSVDKDLTVTPKIVESLTLKAFEKPYGTTDAAFNLYNAKFITVTPADIAPGDTEKSVIDCLQLVRVGTDASNQLEDAGEYLVTVEPKTGANNNYSYEPKGSNNVTMTITKKELKVKSTAQTYKGVEILPSEFIPTLEGLVTGDGITVTFDKNTTTQVIKDVADYTVKVKYNDPNGKLKNYNYVTTATVKVNKALLEITPKADATLTKVFGKSDPNLTDQFDFTKWLDTTHETVTMERADAGNENVGKYEINPVIKDKDGKVLDALKNYEIKYPAAPASKPAKSVFEITSKYLTGNDITVTIDRDKRTYQGHNFVIPEGLVTIKYYDTELTADDVEFEIVNADPEKPARNAGDKFGIKITAKEDGNYAGALVPGGTGNVAANITAITDIAILKAPLEITLAEGEELTKVYDGEDISSDDLQAKFNIPLLDEDIEKQAEIVKMVKNAGADVFVDPTTGEIRGYWVRVHKVNADGTTTYIPETDYKSPLREAGLANYEITFDAVTYTITPKPLTYSIANAEKVYNGKTTNPTFTIESDDVVDADKKEDGSIDLTKVFTTKPTISVKEGKVSDAGVYTLYVSNLTKVASKNYAITENSYVEGENKYEITKAPLTITVLDQELEYSAKGDIKFDIDIKYNKDADVEGETTVHIATTFVDADKEAIEAALKDVEVTYADGRNAQMVGVWPEALILDIEDAELTAALNNFEVTTVPGTLTVTGVGQLILDRDGKDDRKTGPSVKTLLEAYNGQENMTVTLGGNRNLQANYWYTLVLPFDATVREISKAFGYAVVDVPNESNTDAGKVAFKLKVDAEPIPANTLILIKIDQAINLGALVGDEENEVKFEGKTIDYDPEYSTKDAAGNEYHGVYENMELQEDGYWYLSGGTFWNAGAYYREYGKPVSISALGGYVYAKAGAAARIFVEEADGSTTSINAVTGETTNSADSWYSVDGMKLNAQPTQKGVYINNGKKVVIK